MQEIEVRFLEVDHEKLKEKLLSLGAKDLGADELKDLLFYHSDPHFSDDQKRLVRIRQNRNGTTLTFKHQFEHSATGTKEIEFGIDDLEKARMFLEECGWKFTRFVEKRRHSFNLNNVEIDLDLYSQIPPFVELEGESEEDLKEAAKLLGLDWNNVEFRNARIFLKEVYKVPLDELTYFTFDKIE